MEPWIRLDDLGNRPAYERVPDWHAVETANFGELVEAGFIRLGTAEWEFDHYDDEQYERIIAKIQDRFWFREISCTPPGRWKREFIRKLNEIAPKYNLLYRQLENGLDPLQVENRYGKSRQIFSDFPETMLSGNSDYASSGNDREYEDIVEGDVANRVIDFASRYQDIDVLILNELETLFSPFISVSMNGW